MTNLLFEYILEATNKETVVRKFDGIAIGIRKTALGKRHGGSVSKVNLMSFVDLIEKWLSV